MSRNGAASPSTAATSRLVGFYRESIARRRELLAAAAGLPDDACAHLAEGGGLPLEVADRLSENVVAVHGLPLAVALNFRVNGRDVLVPMATEEPSVVAAASNAARLVRLGGGFEAVGAPPIMTAQVQLDDVPDPARAVAAVVRNARALAGSADLAIPAMVARGGGCVDVDVRVLDESAGVLVVHFYVDVRDAMGANVVDTVAEAVAPRVQALTGGTIGLRILSNLCDRRIASATCWISDEAIGGAGIADGIVRASRFAALDPYRAVTHNKGIMNGVDAVALALGQDFRALEAGAHAYASRSGSYAPLATWSRESNGVRGRIELPMAVGTVGGTIAGHAGVRLALQIAAVSGASELSGVMAAVGLASNLAALRALVAEGIQQGHMRLHRRRLGESTAPAPAAAPAIEGGR